MSGFKPAGDAVQPGDQQVGDEAGHGAAQRGEGDAGGPGLEYHEFDHIDMPLQQVTS